MQMNPKTNKNELLGMQFLKSLTLAERNVFYTTIEGNPYEEAAKLLNLKVSTVKKHRENICDKIRDLLGGECTCKKASRVGFSWFKFALKTDIIDGQRWLDRIKEAPHCRV